MNIFGIQIGDKWNEAKAILAAGDALRRGNDKGFFEYLPQAIRERLIKYVLTNYPK